MNQEDIKSMRVALDNMDDYAKMECSIDPIGAYKVLSAGIDMLESLSQQLTECQRGRDAPDGDFGIDNAIAFYHAAQRQAYERAAEVCETECGEYSDGYEFQQPNNHDCAAAIRALIEGDEK